MEAMQQHDSITAEQVADYLRQHRDFFQLRDDLISELNLPHSHGGGTASLIEKQVSVLRERNIEMRNRLSHLLANAETNDQLFQHTRKLILELLDARRLDDVHQALKHSFRNEFKIDHSTCIVFSDTAPKGTTLRFDSLANAQTHISGPLNTSNGVCGLLREAELAYLFADKSRQVASAAVSPIRLNNQTIGILALGSHNERSFQSDMDTLFLNFIADALARIINKLMRQ